MGDAPDRIDDIIDRAIAFTETTLEQTPEMGAVAFAALERMRDALKNSLPSHPGVERLDDYIERRRNVPKPRNNDKPCCDY